jgi:uncharacterized membrane protein YkvA (DUF1232 family)
MSRAAHRKHYSERGFWDKLGRCALAAGRQVVHKSLCLYYTMLSPDTPAWAKTVIAGALGYFIFPLDAIPDALPVVGYSDDLVALTAAMAAVAAHVQPEHGQRADETLQQWFGA